MDRFQSSIEIDAPASVCYQKWHRFDEFPHFMKNVEQVRQIEGNRWHWVVNGPLGNNVEWDATIDGDEANRVISWHSLEGSEVEVQGAVRFDEIAHDKTQVTCTIQYKAPASMLGEAIAHIFSNPEKMVEEDLANFKHLVEGTNVPVEKAQAGKVMQPDRFVVPDASGAEVSGSVAGAAAYSAGTVANPIFEDKTDYESVYDLELADEVPEVGTSAEIASEDIEALQSLRDEEEPYLGLGREGALYSEDLIDMRADTQGLDDSDVFVESMDIEIEDLESFTEDIDEEVDVGLGPRETIEDYEPQDSGALVNPSRPTEDRQI